MSSGRSLAGRRVVITGAGRGLGRALAIVMAQEGADLTLLGRESGSLERVAVAIRARSARDLAVVPCDLSLPESVAAAGRRILEQSSALDVLVNNGAPWVPGALGDLAEADIIATIGAAVTGTILLTRALLPALRRSAAADVVTIVSTAGLPGHHGTASAAFQAAKHGQSGFSERLRGELKKERIRVTAVYPPDFDDTDPLEPEWNLVRDPATGARLTNREVVAAVMLAVTAPRVCAYPMIVLDNMSRE